MSDRMRVFAGVLGAAIALSLGACGGGGRRRTHDAHVDTGADADSPVAGVSGERLSLEAEFVGLVHFTTTRTGTLEATVDWTFAANDLDVLITRGNCGFDQLIAAAVHGPHLLGQRERQAGEDPDRRMRRPGRTRCSWRTSGRATRASRSRWC